MVTVLRATARKIELRWSPLVTLTNGSLPGRGKKETDMASNVDKIVDDILGRVRPLVREAVQKADADARGELMTQLNKAIAGSNGNGKAASVAAPVKRKVGRPRKNPLPETASASPASSSEKPKKKAKAKRVLSAEVKAKLAENLKKAREAKADKAKPAKRKVGRPKKVQAAAPAAAAEQS